jgi:predicted RNA-binding protein YlxR (DUF448 family)
MAKDEQRKGISRRPEPLPVAEGAGAGDSFEDAGEGKASEVGSAAGDSRPAKHVPERKCILSGEHGARYDLIRLALGPDGSVLPDLRAKAGGRGAWIGVDRATLETAMAKGRLKGALARAFKTGEFTIPAELPQMIEDGLRRAALDRLGLEARSGALLAGSDRIAEAARRGQVDLLLHAADASEDGRRKLDQAWRVGRDEEGSGARGMVIPADRTILSMALGRENVVHVALTAPASAARVSTAFGRWCGFLGRSSGTEPCGVAPQGPSAPAK